MSTHYDTDVYAWSQHQAALLREGALTELDLVNLAEEIESVGISQRHAVRSHLEGLVMHLLKWRYQPTGRATGHSWRSTIAEHRSQLDMLCEDSPSLGSLVSTLLAGRYARARQRASDETGLPLAVFPETCPWPAEQVRSNDFWPEADTL